MELRGLLPQPSRRPSCCQPPPARTLARPPGCRLACQPACLPPTCASRPPTACSPCARACVHLARPPPRSTAAAPAGPPACRTAGSPAPLRPQCYTNSVPARRVIDATSQWLTLASWRASLHTPAARPPARPPAVPCRARPAHPPCARPAPEPSVMRHMQGRGQAGAALCAPLPSSWPLYLPPG